MTIYKFYYTNEKGGSHFIGFLPERRRNPKRITRQSIMNRWIKITRDIPIQEGHEIRFERVSLQHLARDCKAPSLSERVNPSGLRDNVGNEFPCPRSLEDSLL